MKNYVGVCLLFLLATGVSVAQEQAGSMSQSSGTINTMDQSPDTNQRLVGQRPLAGSGGHTGGNPDYTDRVSGKAYPVGGSNGQAAASTTAGSAVTNPGGVNPNTGQPLNDKAAVAAAKKGVAVPNNSPEANGNRRAKNMTPSPGAEAAARPRTGSHETNDKSK